MNNKKLFPTNISTTSKQPSSKLQNSVKRRRSLKVLKLARLVDVKRLVNEKRPYVGDRIMAHRGVMDFENLEIGINRESNDGNIGGVLSVANLIDKTMKPSGKRILKLTINHQSPTSEEKLEKLLMENRSLQPKLNRQISIHPERVLDAPDVNLDYPHIMDWGTNNVIAVSLGRAIYLWEAAVCKVDELIKFPDEGVEYVTCMKWLEGVPNLADNIIAIGTNLCNLNLLDGKNKNVVMGINLGLMENLSSITSIVNKRNLLSVGMESGVVEHHDLRCQPSLLSTNTYHNEMIRHLKWSCTHQHLAVVSSGDCLSIWSENKLISSPTVVFRENVLDVVWSHKDSNILLFCHGTYLKMYDIICKSYIRSVNVSISVTCLYWSTVFDELAVTMMDNDNTKICIVHEHSLSTMLELSGHRGNIITLLGNPTGEVIATIGSDEQIRLWNCFKNHEDKKLKSRRKQKSSLLRDLERFR